MFEDITSGQRCCKIYINRVSAAKYKHVALERFEVSEDETITGCPPGHTLNQSRTVTTP